MKLKSQEYLDAVMQQGYALSLMQNPNGSKEQHEHFASKCMMKALTKQQKFYQGGKYMPHQGQQEMKRRMTKNNQEVIA